jgi:hypothetical protein
MSSRNYTNFNQKIKNQAYFASITILYTITEIYVVCLSVINSKVFFHRKKTKSKKNLVHAVNSLNYSEFCFHCFQLENSRINSNILININYEYNNLFDQSV